MNNKLIYVVDDEKHIRELLKAYLEKEGYNVCVFEDGQQVLDALNEKECHMLIVDIMMPNMDGYTVCKEIRKTSEVPIIIVSAKDEEFDRILGLELGSDDYLSKPFSPRELLARMKNIFRRLDKASNKTEKTISEHVKCKDIVVLKNERIVMKDSEELKVTSKEFELLYLLIQNKNIAFSREQIIEHIWGYDYLGDTRQVDDLVKRIRKKLIQSNAECKIETVWGYGYKISG